MAKSFKAPEIEIPEEDFAANDRLSRAEQVRSLAGLLMQLSSPMVVAIDAPWGAGKTTFVRMLQTELRGRGFAAVYYNAWESDFAPDPLVAFLGEIDQEIRSLVEADGQRVKAWESLRSLTGKVVRHGVPAAIKLATYSIVDADKITEELLADSLGGVSSDLVTEYQESKEAIATFKRSVESVLSGLNDEAEHLVVIIDELDRCRPTFSIELLERVKHLFGVPGVVFVLAVDRQQLSHGINAVYGSGFDSQGYLRRFIDFTYKLQTSDITPFVEGLLVSFGLDDVLDSRQRHRVFTNERQTIIALLKLFVAEWGLTLRQLEQLVAQLNIVIRSGDSNQYLFPPVALFLLLLRMLDEPTYERYLSSQHDPAVILRYLGLKYGDTFTNRPDHLAWVEGGFLGTYKHEAQASAATLTNDRHLAADAEGEDKRAREYHRLVLRCASEPLGSSFEHRNPLHIDHLIARIEFLEQIDTDRH